MYYEILGQGLHMGLLFNKRFCGRELLQDFLRNGIDVPGIAAVLARWVLRKMISQSAAGAAIVTNGVWGQHTIEKRVQVGFPGLGYREGQNQERRQRTILRIAAVGTLDGVVRRTLDNVSRD